MRSPRTVPVVTAGDARTDHTERGGTIEDDGAAP